MVRRPLASLLVAAGLILLSIAATPAWARPATTSDTGCASPMLSGPASAVVGESYTVTGCGFAPRSMVALEIGEAGGCCLAQQVYVGDDGRFTYTGSVWASGGYRIRASVPRRKGWTVVATWSFAAA